MKMMGEGKPLKEMRATIDAKYAKFGAPQRREPFGNGAVDNGQKILDVFPRIDDFYDDGEIGRELQYLGGVDAAVRAEPFDPAQHRRTREPALFRLSYDPLVERRALVLVAFADEDAPEAAFFGQDHWITSYQARQHFSDPHGREAETELERDVQRRRKMLRVPRQRVGLIGARRIDRKS